MQLSCTMCLSVLKPPKKHISVFYFTLYSLKIRILQSLFSIEHQFSRVLLLCQSMKHSLNLKMQHHFVFTNLMQSCEFY